MSLYIFSGIRPGPSGVGNLMLSLQSEADSLSDVEVHFRFGRNGGINLRGALIGLRLSKAWGEGLHRTKFFILSYLALFSKRIMCDNKVVLVSPPTLGIRWCKNFISRRKRTTWIYIVDAGFFCIKSVNHISGKRRACLQCLGGHWHYSEKYNCKPFPGRNKNSTEYVVFLSFLMRMAASHKVGFLVQNEKHLDLVKRHFGDNTIVKKVGLWANFDELEHLDSKSRPDKTKYDIVFHGSLGEAKGVNYAIRLANQCPEYEFLFPYESEKLPLLGVPISKNCHFVQMNWNSGLKEMVVNAKLVLCPSLWSAPIEGALVKSIAYSKMTAVVDEPTVYSSEIPGDIVLKLPNRVEDAAIMVKDHLAGDKYLSDERRERWIKEFVEANKFGLKRIYKVVKGSGSEKY